MNAGRLQDAVRANRIVQDAEKRIILDLYQDDIDMALKIINAILILIAVGMGLKQGWAMAAGQPEMMTLFGKWGIGKAAITIIGLVTIAAAILILFPKTFISGNFLMAAGILLIICFHLSDMNIKGVLVELPFFLLNLVIIYLQHPLKK